MPQFRKKPVVIEAVQFDGTWESVAKWLAEHGASSGDPEKAPVVFYEDGVRTDRSLGTGPLLIVRTLEGPMECLPDSWIIQGVNGEFYPCKPDIFEKTYDPAPTVENSFEVNAATENDLDLIGNPDALVWAERFVLRAALNPEIPKDVGTMLAWFASAIMAGYDRKRSTDDELRSIAGAIRGEANQTYHGGDGEPIDELIQHMNDLADDIDPDVEGEFAPPARTELEGESRQGSEYGEILGDGFQMQHQHAGTPSGRVKLTIEAVPE